MKANIEMNTNSDNNTAAATVVRASRHPSTFLKVGTVILSLTALCLSYRAANEAVALYGVLDKVQDTLATEQLVKTQMTAGTRIFETNPSVAGL